MSSLSRTATLAVGLLALFSSVFAARTFKYISSPRACKGTMRYRVTFDMAWTRARFGSRTVPNGAVLAPLTAATHTSRYSPFAEWAYATSQVEQVAEAGNNVPLNALLRANALVGDVGFLAAATPANGAAKVVVKADAAKGFTQISAIGMLAPTPDWVAFENNINVCRGARWARKITGPIYAYDAGTEKTPGVDQQPQQNIYRLSKPVYPEYESTAVGVYTVESLD